MIPLTAIFFLFTTGSSESTLALPIVYLRFTVCTISTFNNADFFSWARILAFSLRTRPFVSSFSCLIFVAFSLSLRCFATNFEYFSEVEVHAVLSIIYLQLSTRQNDKI